MRQIYEENNRKQNKIINEYIQKIDILEKNIYILQRNLKYHITSDKESLSYMNSETQTDHNISWRKTSKP